ncbi:MAG: hypothetical protein H0W65_09525 [Sphingomonas sp.]|uniref:hypothetical protein n=1 Tax=Sphingomonas sp. TaxID=28214 RepID=UPI00179AB7D7|nr:hypothetical protein [Sphingomonas sp.]MBA3667948.1 hypothetical protein [Sphingomonas sp.]
MTAQCNGCRFWKLDESTVDPNDPDWGFGSCRRKPPVLLDCLIAAEIVPPRYGNQTDLDISIEKIATGSRFPGTFATDWCGNYIGEVA